MGIALSRGGPIISREGQLTMADLKFSYVDTSMGQIHIAECGSGEPVILLHQTPRSWAEYRLVLPFLGERFRAIAMDTIGFGASARPEGKYSVELFADGVDALTEAMGLTRYNLVGHHTGGVIGVEVAARNPDKIAKLVLSAAAYSDVERRQTMVEHGPIDAVPLSPDGTHLVELWRRRQDFYGPGHEDSLNRFVIDGLSVFDRIEDGHYAVHAYDMPPRLAAIRSTCLVVCGAQDIYSMPDVAKLSAALNCESAVIAGAGVPLPEQRPREFAEVVANFLSP
jgi:pimeloyl-ACP methyl ester carboxylesterase